MHFQTPLIVHNINYGNVSLFVFKSKRLFITALSESLPKKMCGLVQIKFRDCAGS